MANSWLRLWHDMPTDPKWRTISRISGESIALVTAVYMHMLVDASRNVTRGHVTVTAEDLASALDVTEQQIASIFSAMEGRVIVEKVLSGWDKRQVKREDSGDEETGAKSAAQRKKEQREREKLAAEEAQKEEEEKQCHEQSRTVTLDKNRLDKDKKNTSAPPEGVTPKVWQDFLKTRKTKVTDTAIEGIRREAGKAGISLETALETSCARGWQSFKADWMKGETPQSNGGMLAGAI